MKVCVFGAGAIGAYLAVELALAGHEVSAIARGAHLAAMRRDGVRLRSGGRERTARIAASDDPAAFGPQDYVICALKAHQAFGAADKFAPLLGPGTAVVSAVNGIPWWYFYRHGGTLEGRHLEFVDPGGRQWRAIGPERAIGCIVDPACEIVEPGVVEHHAHNRFTLGEPGGGASARVQALSEALNGAGLDAPVRDGIRWNLWLKLFGNVCFSPISVLTQATLGRVASEPALRETCRAIMAEARAVAGALGIEIPELMIQRRLDAAAAIDSHKISMLQDLERGRSLEIDALVTVVQELGRWLDVPTPRIDLVLALVQERGRQAGLYVPLSESFTQR